MRSIDPEIVAIVDAERAGTISEGWTGTALTLVEAGGLTAVMAPPMRKPDLLTRLTGNTARIVAPLVDRQRLLEHLLTRHDVLPLRPGAGLGPADAADFLKINKALLRAALNDCVGKVQYQLTISWDPSAALGRFASMTGDTAHALATSAEAMRRSLSRDFAGRLDGAVLDRIDQPIDGIETVLNAVLLVERNATAALDQALEEIDAVWSEGLRLRLVGPLPPLSFTLVVARPVDRAERQAAERLLGLQSESSPPVIDRAFRARAAEAHPDHGGDGTDLAALAEARDLLKRLASVQGETEPDRTVFLASVHRDGNGQAESAERVAEGLHKEAS